MVLLLILGTFIHEYHIQWFLVHSILLEIKSVSIATSIATPTSDSFNSAAKMGNGKGTMAIPPPTSATWLPLLPRSPRREKYVHQFTLLRHGWMFSTIDKHGCRLKRNFIYFVFILLTCAFHPFSTNSPPIATTFLIVRKWKNRIKEKNGRRKKSKCIKTHWTLGRRWCVLRRIERVPYSWACWGWLRWCWSPCDSCSHWVSSKRRVSTRN